MILPSSPTTTKIGGWAAHMQYTQTWILQWHIYDTRKRC